MSFVDLDRGIERIKMKIRTDFVTNSSSISTAEIVIDNPMLLEILKKFRDMGTFGREKLYFGIGEYLSRYDGNYFGSEFESKIKSPAFYYHEYIVEDGETLVRSWPKTLAEVLGEIVTIIEISNEGQFDKKLLEQLKAELDEKETELVKNYERVSWSNDDVGGGGDDVVGGYYSFDPVQGEEFREITDREVYAREYGSDYDDDLMKKLNSKP